MLSSRHLVTDMEKEMDVILVSNRVNIYLLTITKNNKVGENRNNSEKIVINSNKIIETNNTNLFGNQQWVTTQICYLTKKIQRR